jgi:hypothetical protein
VGGRGQKVLFVYWGHSGVVWRGVQGWWHRELTFCGVSAWRRKHPGGGVDDDDDDDGDGHDDDVGRVQMVHQWFSGTLWHYIVSMHFKLWLLVKVTFGIWDAEVIEALRIRDKADGKGRS